ncbi:hypothetical protein ABIB62_003451 [Mucilaginibacter sp. UYP25]|uniref:hypothetical protein n=1 Tax=unclassified Mucilaginibacter TaxID=2617802 RepID=UPI003393FE0E
MYKVFFYYLLLLLPIAFIFWLSKNGNTASVGIAILLYAIVYRPLIDGYKLIIKGIIAKKDIWKMYIPSTYRRYFKELYLS